MKFALFARAEGLFVGVVEKIGDTVKEHGFRKLEGVWEKLSAQERPVITFQIHTRGLERSFSYSLDGGAPCQVAALENVYYLCDEGLKKGKRFTGAMLGMYAHAGKDAEERFRAEFEAFQVTV